METGHVMFTELFFAAASCKLHLICGLHLIREISHISVGVIFIYKLDSHADNRLLSRVVCEVSC